MAAQLRSGRAARKHNRGAAQPGSEQPKQPDGSAELPGPDGSASRRGPTERQGCRDGTTGARLPRRPDWGQTTKAAQLGAKLPGRCNWRAAGAVQLGPGCRGNSTGSVRATREQCNRGPIWKKSDLRVGLYGFDSQISNFVDHLTNYLGFLSSTPVQSTAQVGFLPDGTSIARVRLTHLKDSATNAAPFPKPAPSLAGFETQRQQNDL